MTRRPRPGKLSAMSHPRLGLALAFGILAGCSTLKPTRDGNPATGSVEANSA